MMKFIIALLLIPAIALADPPDPKITGPKTAVPGDLIFLDASTSTADHFNWLVDTSGVSLPQRPGAPPVTHVESDGGKKLMLASYPGTWRLSLAVSNAEGVRQIEWKIVVSGGTPQPPGPPNPPPTPDPVPDLSAQAKQWLATVPAAHQTPKKDVAETLDEIGSRASEIGSIQAMEAMITIGMTAALRPLGANAKHWTAFFEKANAALEALKAQGVTVENYGKALQSISRGLQ